MVVVVCFMLLLTNYARNRGHVFTTKCDMVEDGLMECASEGDPGG
jgi:hypothetical protein